MATTDGGISRSSSSRTGSDADLRLVER